MCDLRQEELGAGAKVTSKKINNKKARGRSFDPLDVEIENTLHERHELRPARGEGGERSCGEVVLDREERGGALVLHKDGVHVEVPEFGGEVQDV